MTLHDRQIEAFVRESNTLERIIRDPYPMELTEAQRFLSLEEVTVEDLQDFVCIYEPQAKIRDQPDMNVQIGLHRPPKGGPHVTEALHGLLEVANNPEGLHPHSVHCMYEILHPFMDCNGRSGRILWAWQMLTQGVSPGIQFQFSRTFYHQSLEYFRVTKGT